MKKSPIVLMCVLIALNLYTYRTFTYYKMALLFY